MMVIKEGICKLLHLKFKLTTQPYQSEQEQNKVSTMNSIYQLYRTFSKAMLLTSKLSKMFSRGQPTTSSRATTMQGLEAINLLLIKMNFTKKRRMKICMMMRMTLDQSLLQLIRLTSKMEEILIRKQGGNQRWCPCTKLPVS